jgi:hypothetical protein
MSKWPIILPEIKNDNFYHNIIKLISENENISNVLEIGASSGEGSTEAILIGSKLHYDTYNKQIKTFSLEVCTERFNLLQSRYKSIEGFYPYNMSSIHINEFPKKQDIVDFYNNYKSNLNMNSLETVLSWYDADISYITRNNIQQSAIEYIKKEHNIEQFDCVLIDGSEFTGFVEFKKLYGAKYIMLDDINTYKNYFSHKFLKEDNTYTMLTENYRLRNGYSIFSKQNFHE